MADVEKDGKGLANKCSDALVVGIDFSSDL